MKKRSSLKSLTSFSQAEKLGVITFLIAIPLFASSSWLASIPLLLFVLPCLIAPFFPQWGFFLPIISKSITGSKAVAITIDDGPSPNSTPILLHLLKIYNYKATFFVIGQKVVKYPELISDIIADGHTIGNHSWKHDNLLMLRSKNLLRKDIKRTQKILISCGVHPLIFRPPAGITNPRLKTVLREEQLQAITFSCRAFDHGNKKISNLAKRIAHKLNPGAILLLHDIAPKTKNEIKYWKKEVNALFSILKNTKQEVLPLEFLINSKVMLTVDSINNNLKSSKDISSCQP